jgi:hypothetical protein
MFKRILHKIRASKDYVLYEGMVGPMNFSLVLFRTKLCTHPTLKHIYLRVNTDYTWAWGSVVVKALR